MTTAGWIFMICSLALVLGLNAFCFAKLVRRPAAAEHMEAPLDVDMHDRAT